MNVKLCSHSLMIACFWLLALSAAAQVHAQAQQYPSKSVTIISDSAAGSTPDAVLRVIADRLSQSWGQQVLAVNHPGAAVSIARLTWTRAWKTAFANAPMRCGPHMAACTVKPSSTGLRPNGKCWRHRRPCSPANQIRRRSHGHPHVRRPRERSRGPADAAHHIRDARACSAAISTLSGSHGLGT